MTKKMTVVLSFLLLAGVLLALGTFAGSEKESPGFSITVTQTGLGLEMTCQAGCEWTKLTYSCMGRVPCSSVVNEKGVRGVPTP